MEESEEESVPSRAMTLRAHPSPTTPLTAVSSDFEGHRRRVSFGNEFRHRYPSSASLNAQGNVVVRPKGLRRWIQKLTVKNILLFLLFFALALIFVYFGAFYLLKFDLLHFVGFAQSVPQSKDTFATKYPKQSSTTSTSSTTPLPIKFQLIEAVKYRDLAQTSRLLESGVDVNSVDGNGWTPLHFASRNGYIDVVKLLLEVPNINPNIQTKMLVDTKTAEPYGHYAPLHLASDQGLCQILLALLNASARVNVQDVKHWTALHYASNKGFLKCVLNLLKRPGIDVRVGTNQAMTALHLAARGGHYTLLQPLLDHGAKIDAVDGVLAATPLHYAIKNGHKSAVGILLNRNASVTLKSKYTREANQSSISVLHWATDGLYDKFEILEALLKKGAKTEAVDHENLTPLHWATSHWLLKSAELLLKWNASVDARSEPQRNTPLLIAASKGSPEMVTLLLAYKADIEAEDHLAYTPLILAAKWGHVNVANILLKNGANVSALSKETVNYAKPGLNALHWAAFQNDNSEMIELLLGWNASIDSKDLFEQTALHLASKQGHAKVVKKLLEKGANVSAVVKFSNEPEISRPKMTPLHAAIMNGHLVVVKLLLQYGADIEAEISLERTPLVLAILNKHLNIVKFLLQKQASVFALSRMGNDESVASCTPLQHAAIRRGSDAAEIAELLLQNGADLETEDRWQWRPIHHAIWKASTKVLEVFLKYNANITARARRTNGNHAKELSPILTAAIYSKEPYDDYDYANIMRLLLKRNDTLVRDKDSDGRTPLHHSVLNNCMPCVETLLAYYAPKDARDNNGKTPMDLAKERGNKKVVDLLATGLED